MYCCICIVGIQSSCVCVYVCVCLQVLLNQFLHSPIFFDLCWRILRILPLNQKTRRCHAQHAGVFTTPMRIIDFVCLFPTVLRSLGVAGLRSSPPTCFEGYLKKAGCNYMSEAVVKGTFDEMCFFSGDMYCLCFFTIFTFLTCPESSFRILVTSFSTSSTSQCQSPGQYIHQYWRVVTSPQKGIHVLYMKYICIILYLLIREVLRVDIYIYFIYPYICLFFWIYINTLHFKTSMSFQSIERFVDEAWNWTCIYAMTTSIP